MKILSGVTLIVLTILVAAAMPAGALAKPGYFVEEGARRAEFKVPSSNGYVVAVQATKDLHGKESFYVTATMGHSSVTYLLFAPVRPDDSLRVHLPHVGRIAVRFDPVRTTHHQVADNCEGRATAIVHGYFRGTIQIRGERGFTSVNRTSAPGEVTQSFRQVCSDNEPSSESPAANHREPKFSFTFLLAQDVQSTVEFLAMDASFGSKTITVFTAQAGELREGMFTLSVVRLEGAPSRFVVAPHESLKFAEVMPPAPFEGSARFDLTSPGTSTWEGDLAVELPGRGKVELAGPDSEAGLCKNTHCTDKSLAEGASFAFQVIS